MNDNIQQPVPAISKCQKCGMVHRIIFDNWEAVLNQFGPCDYMGCDGTVDVYYVGRVFSITQEDGVLKRKYHAEYEVVEIEYKSDPRFIWFNDDHQEARIRDPENTPGPIVETHTKITLKIKMHGVSGDPRLMDFPLVDYRAVKWR